jgi:hypothetical protein
MNNTAVNSIIFFGIEIIGIVAVYLDVNPVKLE